MQRLQERRMQRSAIKLPQPDDWSTSTPLQPRAVGGGRVAVCADRGVTRISDLRQSGSLKLVFPKTHRQDVEAVIVNTAGGVTGGDRIDIAADALAGSALTLTTQAAERAYRSQAGEVAQITTNLSVGPSARLNWLPQELILFDRASLRRRLTIDLAEDCLLYTSPSPRD